MFFNTILTSIKPTFFPRTILLIQFSRPATQPQTQPVGHRRCTQPKAGPFLKNVLLGLTSSKLREEIDLNFFKEKLRKLECFKSYNEIKF